MVSKLDLLTAVIDLFVQSNWTVISNGGKSHQVGTSFALSLGHGSIAHPQGQPPSLQAAFNFVSPSTDNYDFSITAVSVQGYPLTDGCLVCVRRQANLTGACTVNLPLITMHD